MEETTLGEAISAVFNYQMENVYTALPGIILKVHDNGETLLVDVQPSVSVRTQTEEIFHRPVILNVPVEMPASNSAGVLFPVEIGDTVMLIFSSDAIDNFKHGDGKPTAPNDYRRFNIRDCVAFPGVFPKSASVNKPQRHKFAHNPKDVVVYHNLGTADEVEVRLKKGESKVIVNCNVAEVNAKDSMTVKTKDFTVQCENYKISTTTYSMTASTASSSANFTHTGNWTLGSVLMNTHRHSGVESGGSTSGGPV